MKVITLYLIKSTKGALFSTNNKPIFKKIPLSDKPTPRLTTATANTLNNRSTVDYIYLKLMYIHVQYFIIQYNNN